MKIGSLYRVVYMSNYGRFGAMRVWAKSSTAALKKVAMMDGVEEAVRAHRANGPLFLALIALGIIAILIISACR